MSSAEQCVGEDYDDNLQCSFCLDAFKNPRELKPCRHIFCEDCIQHFPNNLCCICREPFEETSMPNRALVNMSLNVKTVCQQCGWVGCREKSFRHQCAPPAPPAPPPVSPGSLASSPLPPGSPYSQSGEPTTVVATSTATPTSSGPPGDPYQMSLDDLFLESSGPHQEHVTPQPPPPLTAEEADQLTALFFQCDEDEDGTLNRREAFHLFYTLNYAHRSDDLEELFQAMCGSPFQTELTLEELLTWRRLNSPDPALLNGFTQTQYTTIMVQFHQSDENRDGRLTQDEFVRHVMQAGLVRSEGEAREWFTSLDTQHRGVNLQQYFQYRVWCRDNGRG